MEVVFFSNFLNHHQLPICEAFISVIGVSNFKFIATMPITNERLALGYQDMNNTYPFVIKEYLGGEERTKAEKLALECDIMIFGTAPVQYQDRRLKAGKVVFHYTERLFKYGRWSLFVPKVALRTYNTFIKNCDKKLYVLCAGAYVEHDLRFVGFNTSRCFKWGYFPQVRQYNIGELLSLKKQNSFLWVGRLIQWKHPEYVIDVARRLKANNRSFIFNIIGSGPLYDKLRKLVSSCGLDDSVHVLGMKTNEDVRRYMEESQYFMFTSNRREGWGAVLNEAMNSGCIPIASHLIGSVPYLIEDGVNGLVYKTEDIKSLYEKIEYLMENPGKINKMGEKAYETMVNVWNADNAVRALLHKNESIINNKDSNITNGPGSKAGHFSERF